MADLGKIYEDAKDQGGVLIFGGILALIGTIFGIKKAASATTEDKVDSLEERVAKLEREFNQQLSEVRRVIASIQIEQNATNVAQEQDRVDARQHRARQFQILNELQDTMSRNVEDAIRRLTEHHGQQKT